MAKDYTDLFNKVINGTWKDVVDGIYFYRHNGKNSLKKK